MKCESESREEGICTADEYRCDNGQCIPIEQKCNRRYDCQDGTDETICGSSIFKYYSSSIFQFFSNIQIVFEKFCFNLF